MTVENLEINVKTTVSGSSAKTITNLADALGYLESKAAALTGISNITALANAIASISGSTVKASAFSGLAKGIENLSASLKNITTDDIANLTQVSDALARLNGVDLSGLGGARGLSSAAKHIKDTGKAAKEATKHTSAFGSSLMRIFKYRMIRTVIKEIGQAFKEGLQNAYLFSAGLSTITGRRFAEAMDKMNSAATKMKAQLGSAFISLLTVLEPVVTALVNLVTQAADAVSQLIAAFTGKTYLKAATVTDEYANAMSKGAKAAKEWKNQILAFDVINRLNEDKGSGSPTPEELYGGEESPIDKNIYEFAQRLKFNINDVLFNWDDLTGEQIAKKVITGLGALTGATLGFMIGGVPGAVVGTILGASLGLVFNSLIFNNDGALSRDEILKMVCTVAGALAGGVLGFAVGGPGGAAIGAVVGAGLGLLLHDLIFKPMNEKRQAILKSLVIALSALAGGVIGFAVGGPLGAVIGATIGAGIGMEIAKAAFKRGEAGQEALFKSVIVALGIIAGGLIGFKLGGPAGALLGVAIGAGISLLVSEAMFNKGTQKDNERFGKTLVTVLSALVGGIIGFALGGVPGAVLGVTIGTGLSLAVTEALFDDQGRSLKDKILSSLCVVLAALVGGAIGFVVGGPLGAVIGVALGVGITLFAENVAWDAKSKAKIQDESTNVFSDYANGNLNNQSTGNVFQDYVNGNLGGVSAIPTWPFASGGFPEPGELFIAREAGPELVGTINGRTAVANNDQIVQAVSEGVANAVSATIGKGNGKTEVHVYLDSREIKYGQSRLARATGG